MKIGFFGGCFNPISNIHIDIAKEIINKKYVDKVIFVPVGDYYQKKDLTSAKHRYNMIKLAIEGKKSIEVDDIEIHSNRGFYASEIFELIAKKYEVDDIYFIMGADNFEKMPKWENYNYIIKNYNYIVISRNTSKNINIEHSNIIYVKKDDEFEINSTIIRNKISKEENVSQFLAQDVYNYIKENQLYL